MDLGKVNPKCPERIHHCRCHRQHSWVPGRGPIPTWTEPGRSRFQTSWRTLTGSSHCRCGGNSKKTRIRSETRGCGRMAVISWWNFHGKELASYGWATKVVSWDGSDSGWRLHETTGMTKDLGCGTNIADTAAAGFTKWTPILKEVLIRRECYWAASCATEKSFVKGRVSQWGNLHAVLF